MANDSIDLKIEKDVYSVHCENRIQPQLLTSSIVTFGIIAAIER